MTPRRILLVEDDVVLVRVLRDNLVLQGFEVESVRDGNQALDKARAFTPNLVVLDVSLPGRDGFELCPEMRQLAPVIMLTARGLKADKLRGLNLGADDYVTKPFDLDELLARINVVLRRKPAQPGRLVLGQVSIDLENETATVSDRQLRLTHREFDILRYLAKRSGEVVERDELLREVWGYPQLPKTRSVDHAIARLRRKIERDARFPRFIHTAHGDGYCFTPEGHVVPPPKKGGSSSDS